MRLILLFCLLSLGALPAWALDPARAVSDYTVRSWSMVDGLPHNLVQALAQDEDGLLWIGTWEGIAVFNGHRFRTLPINLPGVGNDPRGIGALLRARDGSMLVGTRHSGVLRYRRGVWQQLGGAAGSKLSVYSLAHGHDGDLWIGTHNGFFRLDREGVLHSVGDLANQRIGQGITALADAQGGVLLGSASGLQRWSPEGGLQAYGQQIGLPPDCPVRALAEFNQGLWIACADGLWMLRHGELKRLLHQAVENLQVDRDGQLWAAFLAGGLLRISQDGHMEHLMGKDRGLSGRNSRGLLEDREGLLWVGTTNGLHRITDAPISGIDAFTGLDDEYVRSILQTRDGSVWVGHSDGIGLWRGGRLNPLHLQLSGQTLVPSVLALAEAREGGVWAGTFANGLLRIWPPDPQAPKMPRVESVDGVPSGQIRALLESADGSLWVGGNFGLLRRRRQGQWERIGGVGHLPDMFVQALMQEPDGTLWIGTSSGMVRRSPSGHFQSWSRADGFPAWAVFDFLRDNDGSLWIASDRGLLRLRDDRLSHYGDDIHPPHEVVFRILDDRHGNLWLSSNNGLLRVAKADLDRHATDPSQPLPLEIFDHNDGMPDSQANGSSQPAGWRTQDGRLWFPTARGVAIVDPEAARRQHDYPIRLLIQSAQIDGIEHDPVEPDTRLSGGKRVRIRYASANLRGSEKLRYRYRMWGMDQGWIEGNETQEAVYTNLPLGHLRFEVQAMRMPVDWERASPGRIAQAELHLHIPQPWWRQPHWMALEILGVLLLLWLGYSLSMRRQRYIRARMQQRIERATQEVRKQRDALAEATREREILLAQLAYQARHDALTGLPNRRAGDEFLDQAIEQARKGIPLAIALFDLDHFKRINDRHGHGVGDDVLRSIGNHVARRLGPGAFVGRHGGEEFLICLPGFTLQAAFKRIDALRQESAELKLDYGKGPVQCTFSAGLTDWHEGDTVQALLGRADALLYRAKAAGRNRVEIG